MLRLNGLYDSIDSVGKYQSENCLIFYSDGTFLELEHSFNIVPDDSFKGWKNYFDDSVLIKNFDCGRNCWGVYRLKTDTIFLQDFENTGQQTNVVVTWEGIIANDTTISFYKWSCKKCLDPLPYPPGTHLIDPPRKFIFTREMLEKPDSSNAWFKKKNWYNRKSNTK